MIVSLADFECTSCTTYGPCLIELTRFPNILQQQEVTSHLPGCNIPKQ